MKKGEFYRKLLHLSGVLIPIIYHLTPKEMVHSFKLGLVIFTLISTSVDLMRFKIPTVKRWVEAVFGGVMRNEERKGITTFSLYLIGSSAVVLTFRREVAMASILVLSICDFSAALVGSTLGKVKTIRGKTLEGSLAFWLTAAIILFAMFKSWKVAPVSLVSSIVEMFSPGILDNLTIPIITAVFLKLIL